MPLSKAEHGDLLTRVAQGDHSKCQHDLLNTCPIELATAINEGRALVEMKREALYKVIKRARIENKATALAIICARLVSTSDGRQLDDLFAFIESENEAVN